MADRADEQQAARSAPSAWLQAGGVAFLALYAVAILAAVGWLFSNLHQISPQNRAIVRRLGAFNRVEGAGLLMAWPRPFEEVILLPSSETILEHDMRVEQLPAPSTAPPPPPPAGEDDPAGGAASTLSDADASIGNRLTGDAGVVQMSVTAFYTVIDPYEYVLQQAHIGPALDRLMSRSVVEVCASRDLDAILVARPELLGSSNQSAEERERLRGDVMQKINEYLAELHAAGGGLGIQLKRVDLITTLHPDTVDAFDSVLTASQEVLQEIANARTDSERELQAANEEADRTIEIAQAKASERLATAQADTADVLQLADAIKGGLDAGLLPRMYRERMAAILAKASLTMVNPRDDAHLIIQGADR
ncbi:MAG TPA: protease modulator HflK [Steroidobacteraceae bacterium]|jgi:regulator of protease activity HflC (stomatin/prohibitin superfamily)|nr:protease modulator HflK [Steroidobacteraceae bacterium]